MILLSPFKEQKEELWHIYIVTQRDADGVKMISGTGNGHTGSGNLGHSDIILCLAS